jgi:hypothetical protein
MHAGFFGHGAAVPLVSQMKLHAALVVCASTSLALLPAALADATDDARAEFIRGTKLAEEAQWSDALNAFEKSAALKSHPLTTYNIGACERALGRYTRARKFLATAMADNQAAGQTAIKPAVVAEGKALLAEIETKLAKLDVRIVPGDAKISVDGRPLELVGTATGSSRIAVAGTRPPGAPESSLESPFRLEIDPGTHIFTLSRAGLGETSITATLLPGQKSEVELKHEPPKGGVAVLTSESSLALGAVDGGALHPLPWTVQLAPGPHELTVRVPGHAGVHEKIDTKPGSTATYVLPSPSLTGSGLVVSASVGAAYSLDGVFLGTLPVIARGVGPASIKIDVSKPGYRPWSGTVAVPTGRTTTVDITLAKDSERRADTIFYVGGGLTLALAASAITTGIFALDAKRTYDGLVSEGRTRDDPDALKVANRGEVLVSITNVLWIGAAAMGLASTGWLLFGGEPVPSTAKTRVE